MKAELSIAARSTAVLVIVSALVVAGSESQAADDRVQVPIRWCAVQGSPAVTTPNCACQSWTSWIVTARGFRASRAYANCRTFFRPAGGTATILVPGLQVIGDPCDPTVNPGCAGVQGDVVIDLATNNLTEYFQAVQACRAAWNLANTGAVGLVGVNIRRFVDPLGNLSQIAGLGGTPFFCSNASQAMGGQFAVTDDDYTLDYTFFPGAGGNVISDIGCVGSVHPSTPPCQPQWFTDSPDTLTGHEIGHALSLVHLAGTVMNATVPAPVTTTMGGFGQTANVCPAQPFPNPTSQCGTVRLQSMCHQNGTIVDPPPVVDEQPFTVGDVPAGHVDLDLAGIVDDTNTGSASVFWRVTGTFPSSVNDLVYQFAIDVDQNPTSGGDPNMVGIQVPLPGAELAGSVTVDVVAGTPSSTASLFRWDLPGAIYLPEPATGSASVLDVFVDEISPGSSTTLPAQAAIAIDFDRTLLTGVPSTYTLRVRAFDPAAAQEDLPSSADLYVHEPSLPVCEVVPDEAAPGQIVTVTAGDLPPTSSVAVWFEQGGAPFAVGSGMTDPGGFASIPFVVPVDALPGMHHVAVMVDAPDATSSHCAMVVGSAAGNPGESSNGPDGQMLVTGHDPGSGTIDVSYTPACAADDHAAYSGDLGSIATYAWDQVDCGLGTSGIAVLNPGSGDRFFVIVGSNGVVEGSYGRDGNGAERPEDSETPSACSHPQDLTMTCP